MKFKQIEPSILYMGNPVVLVTTQDENGVTNIGPISSSWATGRTFIIGLLCNSKTFQNLIKQKECVLNFPSEALHNQVEQIAHLTGACPVPESKRDRYQFSTDKFNHGGFTPLASEIVKPPRIAECPIQLETILKNVWYITDDPILPVNIVAMCLRVQQIHVAEELIINERHINPNKWNPLIYNFRHYFSLGKELGKTFKAEL